MTDTVTSKTLEKLKEQQKALSAKIASEQARIKKEQRKIDTRKKILIGSYFLQQYENKMDDRICFLLTYTTVFIKYLK